MAKGLERQLDAHVTADADEQWVGVALRRGAVFDLQAIASRVPDCGYKLRRIEVEADGQLTGDWFVFEGSDQRVPVAATDGLGGHGRIRGHFEAPIGPTPQLVVDSFAVSESR